MAGAPVTKSSEDDWRGESDHAALQRACEIMADKVRMKGVLRHHQKTKVANAKLSSMLAGHRASRMKGY